MLGMVSVQIGASFAKLLFPTLGPSGTVLLRVLLAFVVLLPVARPWNWRLHRPRTATVVAIAVYGATMGAMNLVFYEALARLPLGITVAIEFMGPLTLAVAGSRRALDMLWLALAVGSLMLLLQPWQALGVHRLDPLGVLLALCAGAAWAIYILAGRVVGDHVAGGTGTAIGMGIATLLVLPIGWHAIPQVAMSPSLLAAAFGMAMLSSALPYSIEMMAMRRMSMRGFSVLMSLEPAIAAVTGLFLLGEHLSPVRWLAILGVVVASLGSAAAGDAPATGTAAAG